MNAQDLMLFEAEAVAVEAAKCEAQRAAEQHEREAKEAAKVLRQIASAKAKAEKISRADDWRPAQHRPATTAPRTSTPNAASAGIAAAPKTATVALIGTTATPAASH